jgi:glycosyltransferase involved in cell wall biosynthesis
VVEALACGTPVIAMARGSMVELLEDGRDGALVGSVDEAVQAVGRIAGLDRGAIRAAARQRFDRSRMASRYVDVYRAVLGGSA